MKKYLCYLGSAESHKYTFEAKDLADLKEKLGKSWPTFKVGEWTEVEVSEGYPRGARKFIVSDSMTWPNLGNCKSYLLLIEDTPIARDY